MSIIGYARVSSAEQCIDLQRTALDKAGAERIFEDDGVSGAKIERPQLTAALDYVRAGDTLTVWKLDRLGRNTKHVLEVIEELDNRGVGFKSLTENIDTTGPMGRAMLTIMAAFAQLERDTMIERTRAGMAAAAKNNRLGGRPKKLDQQAINKARKLKAQGMSATDIAKVLDVGRATVYRYLNA